MSYKSLQQDRIVNFNPGKNPHGWIQWKGTDVCIDIHCKCGESVHFDGDFMYYVRCPYCNQIYEANGHIELIPVDEKEFDIDNSCIQIPEKEIK